MILQTRHELLGIMLLFTLLLEIVGFTGVKSKMSDHDLKLLWYETLVTAFPIIGMHIAHFVLQLAQGLHFQRHFVDLLHESAQHTSGGV